MALPPVEQFSGVELASPTSLGSSAELLSSDFSPRVRKFDFPRKSLGALNEPVPHWQFSPFPILAQNSKHSPVEADV
jgi:hypothetical protein